MSLPMAEMILPELAGFLIAILMGDLDRGKGIGEMKSIDWGMEQGAAELKS